MRSTGSPPITPASSNFFQPRPKLEYIVQPQVRQYLLSCPICFGLIEPYAPFRYPAAILWYVRFIFPFLRLLMIFTEDGRYSIAITALHQIASSLNQLTEPGHRILLLIPLSDPACIPFTTRDTFDSANHSPGAVPQDGTHIHVTRFSKERLQEVYSFLIYEINALDEYNH